MTRPEIIRLSVVGLGIAGVAILLFSIFTRKPQDNSWKEIIKAKDETIQVIKEQRDIYKNQNIELQSEIEQHFYNDSILLSKQKQVITKYEKIPVYINSLDKDRLRAAVTEYQ